MSDTPKDATSQPESDKQQALSAPSESPDNGSAKESDAATAVRSKPSKASGGRGLAMFCLLLILLLAGAGGWGGWQVWQQLQGMEQREPTSQVAAAPEFDAGPLERQIAQLKAENARLDDALQSLDNDDQLTRQIRALAQDVSSAEARLDALTDTSRDDWKLAEAAFLLRLANQRLLVEHNSSEALALAQAADAILKNQSDPKLFAVRESLSGEIMALKTVEPVDREGLYLQIQALIDQVSELAVLESYQREKAPELQVADVAVEGSVWQRLQQSVTRALHTLGSLVRVNRHGEQVQPLLTPEQTWFLRQNLQLMLEQAQVALMREEGEIYIQSLNQAHAWLASYFTHNGQTQVLLQELERLRQEPVSVDLPDISEAQQQLETYIERLHKVSAGETR
ncbi:uroporphyrinogen-III C-methyltransferase [Gilvimarinus xylanilyticus]|uniref:Uroporphyrinogen-III C-methyltransferase n=1 Tax=Gilvimarinus xylanilyticus TaxID=2944139 RepID=A0A9X2HZZ4_9GAMM|nr:uroporphyrinogen-III C-methyltransferase [Gilvimarinus xylanilyticus]MCP8899626.1 uroporphyrinogen-III C-methyltransferase [Gilvimarinus xylanilyticus]